MFKLAKYKSFQKNILSSQGFAYLLSFFILLLFSQISNSEISLVLKGSETQNILSESFLYSPSEIFVNGETGNCDSKTCYLNSDLNNITIRFNEDIQTCQNMFYDLVNITEIDLSNFDASHVTSMEAMFYNCSNLEKITFGKINTSSVDNMSQLFMLCKKLKSIDLSNFDTSSVKNLREMFSHCENIKIIDASNFNTSNVEIMEDIFGYCSSLEAVNLSSFDTSKVQVFKGLFYGCTNLKYLDLRNFTASSASHFWYMFTDCNSLVYVNLYSLRIKENVDTTCSSIGGITKNVKYCVNDVFTSNLLLKNNYSDCSDICFHENIKFDMDENQCLEKCGEYKYETNNMCFEKCPEGLFKVYNGTTNCLSFKPEDFYFDSENNIYKKCYNTCKQCVEGGDEITHNCDLCINNFVFLNDSFVNKSNCYINCNFNYYFDNENNNIYTCTQYDSCPNNYKLIKAKKKCIDNCTNDDIYIFEYNNSCFEKCPNGTLRINETFLCEEEFIKETDTNNFIIFKNNSIIQRIIQSSSNSKVTYECSIDNSINSICNFVDFKNNSEIYEIIEENIMNLYNLDDGKSQIIMGENDIVFQITDGKKELELLKDGFINNHSLSIIELGKCEEELKIKYRLDDNLTLIYLKKETINTKTSEKNITFEVFEPKNNSKLNLSICEDIPINIYVSMNLSEETNDIYEGIKEMGYNVFNINDPFYQDTCTPYKSTNGTDVLLADRINYIYYNEDSQCQSGCEFIGYIANTHFINCTCNSKETSKIIKSKFDERKFYQIFYDVLKYSNFKILKCYKLIFGKTSILKNLGSMIIIIYFVLYTITFFIHLFKGTALLKNKLKLNPEKKRKSKILNDNKIFCNIQINNNAISKKKSIISKNEKLKNPPRKSTFISGKNNNSKRKRSSIKYINNSEKNLNKHHSMVFNKSKKSYLINSSQEKMNIIKNFTKRGSRQKKFDAFELNDMKYEEAIKHDKRSFFRIYTDYLNRESIILFTFFICNDYNLLYIKLARFIFLVATDMSMNVFFFSDDSMHRVFINYGKYNFVQQIPKIIYSFIVSQLIEVFLCYLSLTDKFYYQIKKIPESQKGKNIGEIVKCIKIKLGIFYLFTFLLFGFYWYIIAVFCAVYENTQITFIKDCLSSFALGLAYPIVLYLITSTLRFLAVKNPKNNLKCIFSLSDAIPFF